jgi:hypothetical protein
MKIDAKDRGQLLRMAGNIAGGFVQDRDPNLIPPSDLVIIGTVSAQIAIETLLAVDSLVEDFNNSQPKENTTGYVSERDPLRPTSTI